MDELHVAASGFLQAEGITRAEPVLVAVSGGADSCALLQVLCALGQRVGVAHIHHGLRGQAADRDLEFVRERARALGLAFHEGRVDAARRDGRSPEARARALRYAFLEELRSSEGYRRIATAHTLEDQAETLLLRAIHGTGLTGLAGIAPRSRDGVLLRPLLEVRRASLRGYLEARGITWREDETNLDLSVPRNRIRAEVLPVLEAIHPAAIRKLGDLAAAAHEADVATFRRVEPILARSLHDGDGGVWIDAKPLAMLGPDLSLRALAEIQRRQGMAERVSLRHLERIREFMATAENGKTLSLPLGRVLFRDGDGFWLGPEPGPRFPLAFRRELQPPEPLELPERGLRLTWRRPGGGKGEAGFDSFRIGRGWQPLVARSPEPGDRIRRGSRQVLLSDLFSQARWSRRARARALIVEREGGVVWVVGLAKTTAERRLGKRDDRGAGVPALAWDLVAGALSRDPQSC